MITNRKSEGFQRKLMQRLILWPTDRLRRNYRAVTAELSMLAGAGEGGRTFIVNSPRRQKLIIRETVINAIIGRRLANDSDTIRPKPVLVYKKQKQLRDADLVHKRDTKIYKLFKQIKAKSNGKKKTVLIAAEVRESFPEIQVGTIMNIFYSQSNKERRRRKSASAPSRSDTSRMRTNWN